MICSIVVIADPFEATDCRKSSANRPHNTAPVRATSADHKSLERLTRHTQNSRRSASAHLQVRETHSYVTGRLAWSVGGMLELGEKLGRMYNQHGGLAKRTSRGHYHANR